MLVRAKPDFLEVMNKLSDSCSDILESGQSIFVVYYLEAIVILQHLKRPSVVSHMTVSVTILLSFFLLVVLMHFSTQLRNGI